MRIFNRIVMILLLAGAWIVLPGSPLAWTLFRVVVDQWKRSDGVNSPTGPPPTISASSLEATA